MASNAGITVSEAGETPLNGMGMMLLQYLQQNLEDVEYKTTEGLRLNCRVAVEVEKGIAVTADFRGDKIEICNGVGPSPDLYLKSPYLIFADVLSGKANPVWCVLRGTIQLRQCPAKPLQTLRVLRFLKIPPGFVPGTSQDQVAVRSKKYFGRTAAIATALLGIAGLIYLFR